MFRQVDTFFVGDRMIEYKILVNDKRLEQSLNNEKDKIENIMSFFNISNIFIDIKVLSYDNFKKEFHNYLGYEISTYVTGFIEDNKNTIILLKYDDYKFTSHNGESYEECVKVALHEFVHIVHSIACNRNYPSDDLCEGIAVYLSEQYDYENGNGYGLYYEYGKKIYDYLKINTKKDLLKKLLNN